jgi:hypothetical protein
MWSRLNVIGELLETRCEARRGLDGGSGRRCFPNRNNDVVQLRATVEEVHKALTSIRDKECWNPCVPGQRLSDGLGYQSLYDIRLMAGENQEVGRMPFELLFQRARRLFVIRQNLFDVQPESCHIRFRTAWWKHPPPGERVPHSWQAGPVCLRDVLIHMHDPQFTAGGQRQF